MSEVKPTVGDVNTPTESKEPLADSLKTIEAPLDHPQPPDSYYDCSD